MGNAREWTSTLARRDSGRHVLLLGDWNGQKRVTGVAIAGEGYQDESASVLDGFATGEPSSLNNETGFRCVATN